MVLALISGFAQAVESIGQETQQAQPSQNPPQQQTAKEKATKEKRGSL